MVIKFILNGQEVSAETGNQGILLKYLRDKAGMKGVKEGCGEGECGACSVLIGYLKSDQKNVSYKSVPSCLVPLRDVEGSHIVTIEGLSEKELNPVQEAFVEDGATQCGFCTPGFIVSVSGYLLSGEQDKDIIDAIDGHICRCTGYNSIKKAVRRIDKLVKERDIDIDERLDELIRMKIIPKYFKDIPEMLKALNVSRDSQIDFESFKNKKIIAGGTDILVQKSGEFKEVDYLFLNNTELMSGIKLDDNFIRIGANTTVEEMKNSKVLNEYFNGMSEYMNLISSTLIRNRATVAGNIVNASPIGDISVILLALNADLLIKENEEKDRVLPIENFYKGYKAFDLSKNEIIDEIRIPLLRENEKFYFKKVAQRKHLDIASVNSAIKVKYKDKEIVDCRISAGGVYPYPLYLKELSESLRGYEQTGNINDIVFKILAESITPIDDIRGTAAYKRVLLKNLIISYFSELGK